MLSRIRWFLIITAILLLVVFSLANTKSVLVKMPLVFSREIPLAMLLVLAAMLGFMVGSLWTAWMLRRHRSATPANDPTSDPANDTEPPVRDASTGDATAPDSKYPPADA